MIIITMNRSIVSSSSMIIHQLFLQQTNQQQQTFTTNVLHLHIMSHRKQRKRWIITGLFLFIVTFFMINSHMMLRSIGRNTSTTHSTITKMLTISISNNVTSSSGIIDNDIINHYNNNNRTMKRIPSIAFLFLVDKPMNEEIWERWFHDATDRQMYSIFVHYGKRPVVLTEEEQQQQIQLNTTGDSSLCNTTTSSIIPHLGRFFCQYFIPSLQTEWYWLYDAQMQLLQYSYNDDRYATQFVYVSDTSIPLISFNEMYERLILSTNKSNNNSNDDNDHDIQNRTVETTQQKSRFCLTDNQQRLERAWKNPSRKLNISMNHVKKAEMWSIITRPHVFILLQEKVLLDIWNNTFYSTWIHNNKTHVGAPDETLFPTMLHIKSLSSEQQQYMEQNCTNDRISTCCSTMILWNTPNTGQPVTVYDYETNQHVILSDICEGSRAPCTFISLLDEYGLIALQKSGFFFLRKVIATPTTSYDNKTSIIVVRTKYNETISLNDALIQLHQHQPMMINTTTRKMISASNDNVVVDNNKHDNFQCIVPQSIS